MIWVFLAAAFLVAIVALLWSIGDLAEKYASDPGGTPHRPYDWAKEVD